MRTYNAKNGEIERSWWVVDAKNKTLGRMASEIAKVLRGKNKAVFTPHVDTGDFVIVINSDHVSMSGSKWQDKQYYRHSRFFGGIKSLTAEQQRKKDSTFIITEAVHGMLPKNKLSRELIKKLKVYAGATHPHAVQKPQALSMQ
ncbi:MAG: 50S ribosomal protein L13 [Bdellovibrionales bacterium RBG_16_40_8]|nr:MAG: 50S ribosomal protein L13 [Bdellovibrionales bacterium RBG_16_40_8]